MRREIVVVAISWLVMVIMVLIRDHRMEPGPSGGRVGCPSGRLPVGGFQVFLERFPIEVNPALSQICGLLVRNDALHKDETRPRALLGEAERDLRIRVAFFGGRGAPR